MPTIEHPAEFAGAIMKWWHGMQPAFHKGDGSLPLPLYTNDEESGDVWAPV